MQNRSVSTFKDKHSNQTNLGWWGWSVSSCNLSSETRSSMFRFRIQFSFGTKWNAINAGTFHRGAGILHRIQQVTEYYSWEEQIYKSLDHLIQDSRGGCSFQASQAVGQWRSGDWEILWSHFHLDQNMFVFPLKQLSLSYTGWACERRSSQPAQVIYLPVSQKNEFCLVPNKICFLPDSEKAHEWNCASLNKLHLFGTYTMYYKLNVTSGHICRALIVCDFL